jgi:hypothetical protein
MLELLESNKKTGNDYEAAKSFLGLYGMAKRTFKITCVKKKLKESCYGYDALAV